MEDKEAIEILTEMTKKYPLNPMEKEAVSTAVGVLSWTMLGKSRIRNIAKAQKAKRAKMFG